MNYTLCNVYKCPVVIAISFIHGTLKLYCYIDIMHIKLENPSQYAMYTNHILLHITRWATCRFSALY